MRPIRLPAPRRGPAPTTAADGPGELTVAYLTKAFPRLSETFILDEILGLEEAGVALRLYAVKDAGETVVQPDVARVASRVVYLRGNGWRAGASGAWVTAAAHLSLLAREPRRYTNALRLLLRGADRRTSAHHFVIAGRLAAHLHRDRARHVHAAFAHTPASIAFYAHLLTGLPFSFAAHAKDLYCSNPQNLARRALEAEFVLVCSASAALELRTRAGPRARVVLVYHGVDSDRFKPVTASGPVSPPVPRLCLLAVGRLVAKKGYPVLLDALAEVLRSGHALSCDIVGTGEMAGELRDRIELLGLGKVVTLSLERTHQELAEIYRQADVFVQASVVLPDGDRDGIPNALLEAMASGLAVIASEVAGIPEVVVDSTTGLLIAPGDPGALAAAIVRLAEDRELRVRLGGAARAHVVEHLDRSLCAGEVAALFGVRRAKSERNVASLAGGLRA